MDDMEQMGMDDGYMQWAQQLDNQARQQQEEETEIQRYERLAKEQGHQTPEEVRNEVIRLCRAASERDRPVSWIHPAHKQRLSLNVNPEYWG